MDLNFLLSILVWYGGSGAIAVLSALVVDILKRIPGLVKDGTAPQWASAVSLLGMIAFTAYFMLSPTVGFESVDASLALVVQIANIVLGLALQLFVPSAVHDAGKAANIPVLGYSKTDAPVG
jgi:hypothetical protein